MCKVLHICFKRRLSRQKGLYYYDTSMLRFKRKTIRSDFLRVIGDVIGDKHTILRALSAKNEKNCQLWPFWTRFGLCNESAEFASE